MMMMMMIIGRRKVGTLIAQYSDWAMDRTNRNSSLILVSDKLKLLTSGHEILFPWE